MRIFSLVIIATSISLPVYAQNQDPKQMIVPMMQSFGHTCGQVLYTVPHDDSNQTFDLVCATNANGSGAELNYVVNLSNGTITITPK